MSPVIRLLTLWGLLGVATGLVVQAAAPPARLTPAQQEQVNESQASFERATRLIDQYRPDDAVPLVRTALDIERRVLGRVSSASWLEFLAEHLETKRDWKAAEAAWSERLAVLTLGLGKEHWKVVDARWDLADSRRRAGMTAGERKASTDVWRRMNQGISLWSRGKLKEALPLIRDGVTETGEIFGKQHPQYAIGLHNLGGIHSALGNFDQALSLKEESLRRHREVLGEKHPSFATCLNSLGAVYENRGEIDRAIPLVERALALRKELLGENHPDYVTSLNNLAMVNQSAGRYREALALSLEVLKRVKQVRGTNHPYYASALNNLAGLYETVGEYRRALPLLLESLEVFEKAKLDRHPNYLASRMALSLLYASLGDYPRAVPSLQRTRDLCKATLGEKHPLYASVLNALGSIYQQMGDVEQAIVTYDQAVKLLGPGTGRNTRDHAVSLGSLGRMHAKRGDHAKALACNQQACRILADLLGEDHPDHVLELANLAAVHHQMNQHEKALALYRRVLKWEESPGRKRRASTMTQANLAALLLRKGDTKEALRLYLDVLNRDRESLGDRHPFHANNLYHLALVHHAMKRPREARDRVEKSLALTTSLLRDNASVQSERQQLAAASWIRSRLDLRLSLPDPDDLGPASSYRHVLASKGAVLLLQQQRRLFARLLADDSRPQVRQMVADLQSATRTLAALALNPPRGKHAASVRRRIEALTREKEGLESSLSKRAADFREGRSAVGPGPEYLRKALPADTVLVDYFFYSRHDDTQKEEDQRRLLAFVVRRDQPIQRLELGPAAEIEKAIAVWRETLGRKRPGIADPGSVLRDLIWKPLARHVQGAKVVLVSPDADLARIPFPALPGSKAGRYLIEDVAVVTVPVPAALPGLLAEGGTGTRGKPTLLVVGDVDFDRNTRTPSRADERAAPRGTLTGWAPLPGTKAEVVAIRGTFGRLHRQGVITDLSQASATKRAVRDGLGRNRYVHLATHGFFAPAALKSALAGDTEGDLFGRSGISGWHPLLLSGLVLAGANRQVKAEEEDGILTALEVSDLDLSGCELAVLSACETGLGRVAGGEGVLGLQRAFQVAGARATVTSLWQVPDEATAALMERFYAHLWEGKKSKLDALLSAQRWLLRHGPKHPGLTRAMVRKERKDDVEKLDHLPPWYWAAFVLAGDWR